MKNIKVEIKGINTSELEVLKPKEQMQMLRDIKNGDTSKKDKFINCNLRLVLSIIKKFNSRGENIDDIFQVGVVGLIKAIDNFDMNQNVQFSTYAVPMIIGEIKRYLRDSSCLKISRSIRDVSFKISKIKEAYVNKYNEDPTVQQLARLAEESEDDVIMALDSMVKPMSLNEAIYNEGGDEIYVLDQIKDDDNEMDKIADKISVMQAMEKLSEKERQIIKRRFFDNKTQTEMAMEIGISQAQVSRIEKTAIERLKRRLIEEV